MNKEEREKLIEREKLNEEKKLKEEHKLNEEKKLKKQKKFGLNLKKVDKSVNNQQNDANGSTVTITPDDGNPGSSSFY